VKQKNLKNLLALGDSPAVERVLHRFKALGSIPAPKQNKVKTKQTPQLYLSLFCHLKCFIKKPGEEKTPGPQQSLGIASQTTSFFTFKWSEDHLKSKENRLLPHAKE
jgi:hypothetical protein